MTGESLYLQLRRAGRSDLVADADEEVQCLVGAIGERERLAARQRRLDPPARVGRDADRQELRVDAELAGEPLDRVGRRTCLPALDLAHVLLREAVARELRLRQAGGESQRAQAVAEP